MKCFIWGALIALMGGMTPFCEAAEVTIDNRTVVSVNGFDRIERELFGINAYHGATRFDPALTDDDLKWLDQMANRAGAEAEIDPPPPSKFDAVAFLDEWGIESLGMPGRMNWVFEPLWPHSPGAKEMTLEDVEAWFANPKGASWYFNDYDRLDRYVYGRILPELRKRAKANLWLYLLGCSPKGTHEKSGVPTDFERWARLAVLYLELVRKADPELQYIHLYNEPNSHWFHSKHTGQDYADFFALVSRHIKERFPDMKIGGPVLCWPPTWGKRWRTWKGYSKPLIDTAGESLDFFDFHAYGHHEDIVIGDMFVVTAYAKSAHDRWLRCAVTEANFPMATRNLPPEVLLPPEIWHDRTEHFRRRAWHMARQTLAFMRHPDKVFCRQVHDLHAVVNEQKSFKFWGHGDLRVTPMMELFQVCKPLRGRRIHTTSDDATVWVEAAVEDGRLAVALLNTGDETKTVACKLPNLSDESRKTGSARVFDAESLRDYEAPESGEWRLPSESLVVATFDLAKDEAPSRLRRVSEFFPKGDAVMRQVRGEGPYEYEIALSEKDRSSAIAARLRVGFKGRCSDDRWRVKIGDTTLDIEAPGAFHEIDLPAIPKSDTISISLSRDSQEVDIENRVSFISLALITEGSLQ